MPNLESVYHEAQRPDAWSTQNAHCRARYEILASAEPDLLCRVLNMFAMQYLIPLQVSALQQDSMLMIEVQVQELTWHRAQVIGEKMRNLIDVCSVDVAQVEHSHAASQPLTLAAG